MAAADRASDDKRLADVLAVVDAVPRPLRALYACDLDPNLASTYVVKHLLALNSLGLIIGAPGSGKSFFAQHIALHVAAGRPWRDRLVRGGLAIYCAPEAPLSAQRRAVAALDDLEIERGVPFAISPDGFNLRHEYGRVIELARRAEAETGAAPQIIVIDTLSRAFGAGDENASADMGAFIAGCDALRDVTGACVLVVHHLGKDQAKGARGSSLLQAAADTVIEIVDKVATVKKQRDGEVGTAFTFALRPVVLGVDEDGDDVTTCVVDFLTDDAPARAPRRPALSAGQHRALRSLHAVLGKPELRAKPSAASLQVGAPDDRHFTTLAAWRDEMRLRAGNDKSTDAVRKAYERARDDLQDKGEIVVAGDFVWLTTPDKT